MSTDLQKLIEDSQAPLSAAAVELAVLLRKKDVSVCGAEFVLPDELLSGDPPMFVVELKQPSLGLIPIRKTAPWSSRLEREHLFPLRITMSLPDEEALRAGMNMLSALTWLDVDFGKDYVSAVLWEIVHARYSSVDAVARTLGRITHHSPHQSEHLLRCQNEISRVIDGYRASLIVEFGYEQELAGRIVIAGLVFLLDRRHSLTIRSVLFPPSGSFSF